MPTRNLEFVNVMALSVLLVLAIWYDWRTRKIPNALVLCAVLTALSFSLTPWGIGLNAALLGGMIGFLVFLFLYLFRMMGAGDVKLIAAVGLFVGWPDMTKICVAILLAGGLLSVAWALWRSNMVTVLINLGNGLTEHIRAGRWPSLGQPLIKTVTKERVPYALAVGLGVAAYYVGTT